MYLRKDSTAQDFTVILTKAEVIRMIKDLAEMLDGRSVTADYNVMHGEFGYENLPGTLRLSKDPDEEA